MILMIVCLLCEYISYESINVQLQLLIIHSVVQSQSHVYPNNIMSCFLDKMQMLLSKTAISSS